MLKGRVQSYSARLSPFIQVFLLCLPTASYTTIILPPIPPHCLLYLPTASYTSLLPNIPPRFSEYLPLLSPLPPRCPIYLPAAPVSPCGPLYLPAAPYTFLRPPMRTYPAQRYRIYLPPRDSFISLNLNLKAIFCLQRQSLQKFLTPHISTV